MTLNAYTDHSSPAWQVIEYIKRKGSATIKELEEVLGVTTNAVRQHLQTLQADGYVERTRVSAGVGRPHHAYSISAKAHELFACHCDDLALTLLEEVFALEGPERSAVLLERVGNRLAQRYAASVRGEALQDRVVQLADALYQRGVLTDIDVEDENVIVLHAYNCPYHELAQEHRSICEMDEDVMRTVLGSDVNLSACMMDGHRGCSFVVSKPAGASKAPVAA
jgi:DeoR family transcriptional regulator, suf operon transcriptional repressor